MAHREFFGDSYQYSHRLLLETIPLHKGEWTVHPMMFRAGCECTGARGRCPAVPGGGLDVDRYAGFLGLGRDQVLSVDDGGPLPRRSLVADVDGGHEYLFLDPDTGIDLAGRLRRPKHITGTELAAIARQDGRQLVLVFERSYRRENLALNAVANEEVGFLCNICLVRMDGRDRDANLCTRCRDVVSLRRKLANLCRMFDGNGEPLHCGAVVVSSGSRTAYVWVSTNPCAVRAVRGVLGEALRLYDWRLLACPCAVCTRVDPDYWDDQYEEGG